MAANLNHRGQQPPGARRFFQPNDCFGPVSANAVVDRPPAPPKLLPSRLLSPCKVKRQNQEKIEAGPLNAPVRHAVSLRWQHQARGTAVVTLGWQPACPGHNRGQGRIDNEIGGNVLAVGLNDSRFGLRLLTLPAHAKPYEQIQDPNPAVGQPSSTAA
jgi:hypothetical protein